MKLDKMADDEIDRELERQQQIQKTHRPDSQMWISASRVIHHLAAEKGRRYRAQHKALEEQPT